MKVPSNFPIIVLCTHVLHVVVRSTICPVVCTERCVLWARLRFFKGRNITMTGAPVAILALKESRDGKNI